MSDNIALQARAKQAQAERAQGLPAAPFLLGEEKATNPFLRADDPKIAEAVGMPGASTAAVFAELRRRKDVFEVWMGEVKKGLRWVRQTTSGCQSPSSLSRRVSGHCRARHKNL